MAVVLFSFATVAFFAISAGGLRRANQARGANRVELVVGALAILAALAGLIAIAGGNSGCHSFGRGVEVGGDC